MYTYLAIDITLFSLVLTKRDESSNSFGGR